MSQAGLRHPVRVWPRLALLAGAVLLSVAGAEGGLRLLADRLPVSFLVYMHRSLKDERPAVWNKLRGYLPYFNLRNEDPNTGWTFKPNTTYSGTNEDGQPYQVTTSAEGFFTPDLPTKESSQLVVLGDSFLSTFYVPSPTAWVLRRELREPVYNLAVHGWGPDSYLAAYNKFAAGRRHRQVLVFTFMNDVTDVVNWAGWKHEAAPGLSFLTWIQRQNPDDDAVNTGASWPDRHSLLWNLLKMTMRQRSSAAELTVQPAGAPVERADPSRLETFPGRDGGRFQLQLTKGFPFLLNDPEAFWPSGSYYAYMQCYFESLDRLRAAIEARGAQMVLIWIPSKERVHVPLLPLDRKRGYVSNKTGDVGGVEPVVAAYAAQSGVAFLDLTAELSRRAAEGDKLYFTVDGHWNDAGNEAVGKVVTSFVRALPVKPPAPITSERLVMFRRGPLTVSMPLEFEAGTYRSPLARSGPLGWVVRGVAESAASYVVRWPEATITQPMFLVARGVLHRGGLTIGLLQSDAWSQQMSVTSAGAFDVALPVSKPGTYTVVIANNLPAGSLENDFDVRELGWAALPR